MNRIPPEYAVHRPRIGQTVTYADPKEGYALREVGTVSRTEGALCWINPLPGNEGLYAEAPFIWVFHNGLNPLHKWDGRPRRKCAPYPGVSFADACPHCGGTGRNTLPADLLEHEAFGNPMPSICDICGGTGDNEEPTHD